MKTASILLAATLPLAAQSNDWTRQDTYRETACAAISIADWGQTLNIQDCYHQGTGAWEQNPILGRHPSRAQINTYFAASIGLHYLIARMLPAEWRHAFQYVSLGFEAGIVTHNYHLGFQVRF